MHGVHGLAVALLLLAPTAFAGEKEAARAAAPRLLREALRTGTVEDAAFAAITDWILHEKEETVAAGLVDVLGSVDLSAARTGGSAQYDETAAAVIAVFTGVLRDAASNRRPEAIEARLSTLVGIAAPAIAASLRATPAPDQARLVTVFRALGPVASDLAPVVAEGLRHPQREVRIGAATALGALGRGAGASVPDLRALADDPDPHVRAAAAQALERIRPE